MPISAQIEHVDKLERATIIFLMPLPGQTKLHDGELIQPRPPAGYKLLIENPTYIPNKGDFVAGNREKIEITGSGYRTIYDRISEHKLIELDNKKLPI